MFRNLVLGFTCLAGCLASLPAQAQAAPTSPQVVHVWHAMRGARAAAIEKLSRQFEQTHPEVKIELKAVLDVSQRSGNDYAALYRAMLESLAVGKEPEVAQFFENWVTQLEGISALAPLDSAVSGLKSDLLPVFQESVSSPDGKIYSVPFNKTVWVLYVNKGIFAKLGLQPPKTWVELRQVSLQIQQKTGLPGLVFQPGVDAFGDYLLSQGGQFLDAAGKPDFGGAIGQESLNYWSSLTVDDHSALPTIKAMPIFAAGNAGMLLETTSKLAQLESQPNLQITVVAVPAGRKQVCQLAGTNLGIFQASNPAVRQAALDYIRFMTTSESGIELAEQSGYLPVRKSSLSDPGFKAYLAGHPNYAVGVQALENAVIQPRVAGWESIRGLLDDAFFSSLSRQSTAKEALQKANDLAGELLVHLKGN